MTTATRVIYIAIGNTDNNDDNRNNYNNDHTRIVRRILFRPITHTLSLSRSILSNKRGRRIFHSNSGARYL